MIKVEHLQKTYPGKVPTQALKDVSFEIKSGEFAAVMGRSGSGKSTLLHQLGLLDTPSSGKIFIDGLEVGKLPEAEKMKFRLKSLGYVFQEYALIAELTAFENVYLPVHALNGRENGDDDKKRAKNLLQVVGLGGRLDHYPSGLSGGEQQRVAIARALVNQPKILFADEPTANLDSASSKIVLELFRKLNSETGQTIVMVTHEPEDERYVDRVLWLKDGLIKKGQSIERRKK